MVGGLQVLPAAAARDPLSNLRPTNITSLEYYLYRWTGSYYNGTTKVRIEPRDIEDVNGRSCATAGRPVEFTLEKALLAVVKSNRYIEQQNDFTFSLAFWDESLGESPPAEAGYLPLEQIQYIDSVSWLNTVDVPVLDNDRSPPSWKLTTSHIGNASYSFTGARNASQPQLIGFNYTTCSSSVATAYVGSLLDPLSRDLVKAKTYPAVTGRFDGSSASMEIKAVALLKSMSEEGKNSSYIGGPITISFEGKLDGNRSDL
ncbi:hypothetical protein PLICBS_000808 [Purpureocillium lilacinum]|uniref:uncharacterized protein n=1 Tax=Purpureocillium lilacinum TaxID=33203 RepID=UPI002086BFE1|nr:hypothetical protein PLICBS_000808 [Purpureocillium lilacinum]